MWHIETTSVKKSKVQRKPFGCAITHSLFPSEKTLQQHRMGNHAGRTAKNGIQTRLETRD